MIIKKISVKNTGFVYCKSRFYTAQDSLSLNKSFSFSSGINIVTGEIDSGIWAASYLLSMYKYRREDFILFEPAKVSVNNTDYFLDDLSEYSCYMDKLYPIFSSGDSIRNLVLKGLSFNKLNCTPEEIRDLFCIDVDRFERPLTGVGNEVYKAMAAIGYCHNKKIFCFPWLSKKRFDGYHVNMTGLLAILDSLNVIVVLPIGKE